MKVEPTRQPCPLPERRQVSTSVLTWEGRAWLVGVGFDHSGHVREIFVDGVKAGTSLEATADDLCIVLSKLLQAGYRVGDVLGMLCHVAEEPTNYCNSLSSALLKRAVEEESLEQEARGNKG